MIVKTTLGTGYGNKIFYNQDYLQEYEESLLNFLEDENYMHTLAFAKEIMLPEEIKANNNIEGIRDDLSEIGKAIKNSENTSSRITNLYQGYRYILKCPKIDKESLKYLYAILSKDLLSKQDFENMGEYYRTKPVYIDNRLDKDFPIMGMDAEKVEYYMDEFLDYVNEENTNNEMEDFIKSQIMHFYFVHIHPYFDVNGRTSRTTAMWYLLNHKAYPYIILNRAITFDTKEYENSIKTSRNRGDVTIFLKYMITQVHKALEKEYILNNIKSNTSFHLKKEDSQMIEYLISLNGSITIKDLVTMYNRYNPKKKPIELATEIIDSLINSGIILDLGPTKKYITPQRHNSHIALNPQTIDINSKKLKYLKIDKYTNPKNN